MPNPYPVALRERAVRAYEDSTETYQAVAARFAISVNALVRWVQRARATGEVAPRPKGGGWRSPVDLATLHRLVSERPDRTTDELTRVYNCALPAGRQVQRSGYVFKKTITARGIGLSACPRRTHRLPAVGATVDPYRLVILDVSGVHLAMGRSHAWLRRGTELIEPRPMNWGRNLTLVGAMRAEGWLTLATS